VRERKPQVLADDLFVVGLERCSAQETGDLGYIVVRKQVRGVRIQESGGDQDFEPLVAIELQDAADAIQDFAAHTTVTRFEPAQRAAVDRSQVSHLFLG
jgi:hypothetical protein